MSDLMKLGPQALGAMAQGQMQSIAPSYMVIAALKALTDQQRGTGAQVPQGTVKDQVLAQAAPPAQAGIGAMGPMRQGMPQPVRQFAGGGPVGTDAVNAKIANYFRQMFGPGWDNLKEETRRGLAGRRRTEDEFNYGNEGNNYKLPKGTEATKPDVAERVGTEKGRATNPVEGELKPGAPVIAPPQIVAPAAARGVGSAGVNPLAKYAPAKLGEYEKMGELAKPDQYKLDIPKNAQLGEEAERYKTPDPVRIKELREAEEGAGLAAFGRGMLGTKNGTGFGAVFGSAAADYVDAKEAKAEKRRAYLDEREKMATQLGIQVGAEAKADYLANSKWGAERADATNQQAIRVLQAQNEATRFGNAEILDREKMAMTERIAAQSAAIQREANRLQAEIRKDGVDQQKFQRLLNTQQVAADNARKLAETKVGKPDDPLNRMNPDFQRRFNFEYKQAYESTFPPALEALLQQGLGIGATAQPQQAAPGKVVRGRL
ncbi:MAG: hypothetical protein IPH41_17600 [Sulfuritalea sp.]|nr:hypothetical protein [Sulfuritalea sp.]